MSSAFLIALNPSAIFAMWPSKIPIAIEVESWNRWLAQGNGYGLYGQVLPHTEVHPVALHIPMVDLPLPVVPVVYFQCNFLSCANTWLTSRSHSWSIGVLPLLVSNLLAISETVRSEFFAWSKMRLIMSMSVTSTCCSSFLCKYDSSSLVSCSNLATCVLMRGCMSDSTVAVKRCTTDFSEQPRQAPSPLANCE